jgi:hypothetical protein
MTNSLKTLSCQGNDGIRRLKLGKLSKQDTASPDWHAALIEL